MTLLITFVVDVLRYLKAPLTVRCGAALQVLRVEGKRNRLRLALQVSSTQVSNGGLEGLTDLHDGGLLDVVHPDGQPVASLTALNGDTANDAVVGHGARNQEAGSPDPCGVAAMVLLPEPRPPLATRLVGRVLPQRAHEVSVGLLPEKREGVAKGKCRGLRHVRKHLPECTELVDFGGDRVETLRVRRRGVGGRRRRESCTPWAVVPHFPLAVQGVNRGGPRRRGVRGSRLLHSRTDGVRHIRRTSCRHGLAGRRRSGSLAPHALPRRRHALLVLLPLLAKLLLPNLLFLFTLLEDGGEVFVGHGDVQSRLKLGCALLVLVLLLKEQHCGHQDAQIVRRHRHGNVVPAQGLEQPLVDLALCATLGLLRPSTAPATLLPCPEHHLLRRLCHPLRGTGNGDVTDNVELLDKLSSLGHQTLPQVQNVRLDDPCGHTLGHARGLGARRALAELQDDMTLTTDRVRDIGLVVHRVRLGLCRDGDHRPPDEVVRETSTRGVGGDTAENNSVAGVRLQENETQRFVGVGKLEGDDIDVGVQSVLLHSHLRRRRHVRLRRLLLLLLGGARGGLLDGRRGGGHGLLRRGLVALARRLVLPATDARGGRGRGRGRSRGWSRGRGAHGCRGGSGGGGRCSVLRLLRRLLLLF
eukprot:Hpha_TRINITY_DN15240_c3_g3::TRINITY_DN15240_c3_g3_i1::g.66150::m.66150